VLADQGVQPGNPARPLGQSSARQHLAVIVDNLDIVMVLGPVISHEQHRASGIGLHTLDSSVEDTASDLMVKCSPHRKRGTSSQQRFRLLTTSGRTACRETCAGQMRTVLTHQSLPAPNLPNRHSRSH
jgi:hypothetical protein